MHFRFDGIRAIKSEVAAPIVEGNPDPTRCSQFLQKPAGDSHELKGRRFEFFRAHHFFRLLLHLPISFPQKLADALRSGYRNTRIISMSLAGRPDF
jgi:hypothetical protein